jgi:nucleoside-diphosphate-sugar epimerase
MTETTPLAADLNHVLDHTAGLWEELRGQRIFITGGTGFFGCWLLESFAWANNRLDLNATAVVLTRSVARFQRKAPHLASNPAIRFHIGDVRDFDFPAGEFSHVIHAATEASAQLNGENPLALLDTIVEGTRHTLDFARHCGTPKFLLTSSGAVYGKQPLDLTHVPEDYAGAPDPVDPRSTYGEGKRLAEHLCALYAQRYGVQTKIARCFAFAGPYLPLGTHFAIGSFIRDGLREEPIRVKGDGTPYRSYLYAADLTIWLWTILFKGKSCFPYNVGSDEPVSIAELANLVAEQFELRPRVEIERNHVNGLAGERYIPSIERVRREFGLHPTIGLAEAVRRTSDWVRCVASGWEEN